MRICAALVMLAMMGGCHSPNFRTTSTGTTIISGDPLELESLFGKAQVVNVADDLDSFRFNSSGERIYYTSIKSQNFGVIHTKGHEVEAIHLGCSPSNFVVDNKDQEAYVMCSSRDSDGLLLKISLPMKKVTGTLTLNKGFISFSLVLTSDAKRLYVTDANSLFLYMLDAKDLKIYQKIALQEPAGWRSVLSPDETRLYVLHPFARTISVMSTRDNSRLDLIRNIGTFPTALVASKDGNKLYVGDNEAAIVTIFDTTTFQTSSFKVEDKTGWFSQHLKPPDDMVVVPDLAMTTDQKLFMWHPNNTSHLAMVDLRGMSVIHLHLPSNMRIAGMALDNSGRHMALSAMDKRLLLFTKHSGASMLEN
ncbi:YncE family protein [Nitrospira defluvii]|uniref:Uncharacterized protein n=1 Tax=Nitrospira defluvii TaxID=330214 RepID=A0ABM8QFH6_9BACT|nr:YncE family protein [Nitrospira defluvii]CAE6694372.1 exported hypothetical protein [Nitrospira defluvii]